MVAGSWLTSWPDAGDAAVRLLCFAHAGGGGAFFRPWRDPFLPEVEVRAVVLPGREGRLRERPYARIDDLVPPLFEALVPYADRPFALLGHSMGAVVAYEVARRFEAGGAGAPLCLFVSGRRPPHLPTPHPPRHLLPDERFLPAVAGLNGTPAEILARPELRELFLPSLRADFEVSETYRPLPGGRLACPVSALAGDADPEASPEELLGWREATGGPFRLRVFRGDHFYLKGPPPELVASIREDLVRLAAVQP